MIPKNRTESPGVLKLKGNLNGVSVLRVSCDADGKRSVHARTFNNFNEFMSFVCANYWGKPTSPNGGDT
jgi:hypothetical protein